MAVGLPLKTTYADGDVYSSQDVNDTNGTINITAAPYAAGKNKIINGDFYINQRKFTSNTTSGAYGFDRWLQLNSGGTFTTTPQVFTPGAAPVAGYEGKNFLQGVVAAQSAAGDYAIFMQRIENARTFAGQNVAFSFWAKATSGTPKIALEVSQSFGSGGSSPTYTAMGAVTISTSWARYTITGTVPSISGKTVGTANDCLEIFLWCSGGSTFASRSSSIGIQNNTFQVWGIQMENGLTATAFQTATGTIQGELAACQRYYYRVNWDAASSYAQFGAGAGNSTTQVRTDVYFPVQLRVAPTAIDYPTVATFFTYIKYDDTGGGSPSAVSLDTNLSDTTVGRLNWTGTSITAQGPYYVRGQNQSGAYLGWSAEL